MISSKRLAVALLLTVFLDSSLTAVEVKRPRILGVAHMALFVSDLPKARAFYKDFLGYEEPYVLKREDGSDRIAFIKINENQYLEFMLYDKRPDAEQMGVRNHICLITPDIKKAVAILETRPARKNYNRPIEIKVGKNGKRQANLFDPDGTRIELMEPNTVDGKPVPPSIAPPPIK